MAISLAMVVVFAHMTAMVRANVPWEQPPESNSEEAQASPSETPARDDADESSVKSPTRIRYERIRVLASRLDQGIDVEDELAKLLAEVADAVAALPAEKTDTHEDADTHENAVKEPPTGLTPQQRGEALSVYFGAVALADWLERNATRPVERFERLAQAFHAATVLGSWKSAGRLAGEITSAAIEARDVELARPWLIRALDVLPENDEGRRSDLASSLAQVENFIGNWDAALRRLDQAEAELPANTPRLEMLRARIAGFRGEVFLSMGLVDQCATWCEREWDVMRDVPDELAVFRERARIHRVNMFLAAERFEDVVAEIEPLLAKGSLEEYPLERAALLVRLGIALASLERADPARPERAVSVLESVVADTNPETATERSNAELRIAQTHLERGRLDEAQAWIARVRDRAKPARLDAAYEAALEAKLLLERRAAGSTDDGSRLAATTTALRAGLDALVESYDAVLDEWYELRLRQGGAGLMHYETVRFVLSVLIEATRELNPNSQAAAFAPVIAGLRASTLSRRLGVGPGVPSLEELITTPPDEPIVLFLPAIDTTHVFWIDDEGVFHARAPARPHIEAMRIPFVDTITRSPYGLGAEEARERIESLMAQGTRLFDALFPAEIRERLARHDRITIAASDLLVYLPFEALVRDGEWLGRSVAIGYTPSPAVAAVLRDRADRRDAVTTERPAPNALVVAAPSPGEGAPALLPVLPFDTAQRERLADSYTPGAVEFLVGDAATLSNTEAAIERAGLTHFLVHGIHDYSRERTAGLVLAPEADRPTGVAWAPDLDPLSASPVVLLTACGTGRGPARWGDAGSSHLGGIFLAAGADTVVLPIAEVAYDATLEMAVTFHARLAEGAGPAEALRDARVRVSSRDEFRDPYYFALLHARGLAHRPVFSPAPGAATESPNSFELELRLVTLVVVIFVLVFAIVALVRLRR